MSFDADQARLVKELADAQEQIRAQYGLSSPAEKKAANRQEQAPSQGRRSSLTAL